MEEATTFRTFQATTPDEEDEGIIEATDVLKRIHVAISQQSNLDVDLDAGSISQLRSEIKVKEN
jgi:hypothetical protein